MTFKERDALYYPYVHIRDVNWLKRTLLIFPHIVRMVPRNFTPDDKLEIRKFASLTGAGDQPLLRQADLTTESVAEAQGALLKRIQKDVEDDPSFLQRYNKDTTNTERRQHDPGFQMYPDKISQSLFCYLEQHGLAWEPDYADGPIYRELHPRIGEAVMSTVAVACAKDEGLDFVTEESQGQLSHCLAMKDIDAIYGSWIHRARPLTTRREKTATSGHLLEIIVYQHCDPSKLTADSLSNLSHEREALAALHEDLQKLASKIPDDIESDTKLKERLQDSAQEALKKWKQNRANLSALGKEILGIEGVKEIGKLVQELAKKAATPEVAGSTASGAIVGGLQSGTLLGAAAGFAVGVVVHAISSWDKVRQREATSPYRYLTMLEKAGVAFTVGK